MPSVFFAENAGKPIFFDRNFAGWSIAAKKDDNFWQGVNDAFRQCHEEAQRGFKNRHKKAQKTQRGSGERLL
jgi:hypothetical protein